MTYYYTDCPLNELGDAYEIEEHIDTRSDKKAVLIIGDYGDD